MIIENESDFYYIYRPYYRKKDGTLVYPKKSKFFRFKINKDKKKN